MTSAYNQQDATVAGLQISLAKVTAVLGYENPKSKVGSETIQKCQDARTEEKLRMKLFKCHHEWRLPLRIFRRNGLHASMLRSTAAARAIKMAASSTHVTCRMAS